jgi:hypothetical protein
MIEARNGLYRFRDLAASRQVAGLLAAGTALSVITKSLHDIDHSLPIMAAAAIQIRAALPIARHNISRF